MKKIVYKIFLALVFILRKSPKFIRRGFFRFLSALAYLFANKTNKIIKTNLKFIFNDKISEKEIKEIQKYSYFNMLLWVQSLIENLDITDEELLNTVSIENKEIVEKVISENKPIIFISAHFGNMEMLSTYINKNVAKLHQVARQSNFEEIDEFIVKAREKSGSKIVFRKGAVKKLVKALIKKEAISLIIDQNINSREGTQVDFLGKKAYQASTSAILARKFDAVIIPLAIFNKNDYKYKIKVYNPILPIKTENEENDIKELSQLQANAISDIILEDKKQWFWPHKRFKSHYREIYEKNFNN
ncbi:lipid A biosynthesis lauroyl acyltransferase [Poseidonibacter antarcticus]|uniref:lipid A biosynthesis lauroyl acyltransferase n=1 Tax=Poseidonibacter antarcticus TaxID=2478538 RepID=UPI000EF5066A|nr:lipid A biosynthesis lauroyl acyltransferase [Poseidonibacter antarcticus]